MLDTMPVSTDPAVDSSPGRSQDKETKPEGDKETKPVSAKEPKPEGDKKRKKPGDEKPKKPGDEKIKTAVHLSREAILKLGAACVYEAKTQSQLIELLIKEQLSTYSVQAREQDRRVKFSTSSDRSKSAAGVSVPRQLCPDRDRPCRSHRKCKRPRLRGGGRGHRFGVGQGGVQSPALALAAEPGIGPQGLERQ